MIYLRFFCVLLRNAFGTRLLLSLKTKFLLFSIARNNRTCASAFLRVLQRANTRFVFAFRTR